MLKIRAPLGAGEGAIDELALIPRGALLLGQLQATPEMAAAYAAAGIDAGAMELLPRITRAQSMDILSSQANLAGYRAVIEAASDLRPRLPHADDRGRHHPRRQCLRHGRRRRRAAGDRHRPPARRPGLGDRRPAGGEGGDQVARRQLRRPRGRGKPRRPDRRRLCQADERRLHAEAGRGRRRPSGQAGHRHHHRPGAGPQGADAGDRGDGREHEAGQRHRRHRLGRRRQRRADQAGRGLHHARMA